MSTGVSYGVLRDIESMIDLFCATRCILAFDGGGKNRRELIDPNYKSTRRNRPQTDEERHQRELFYDEVHRLREQIFPEAGFRNILREPGFEADDIIAQVAKSIPKDVDAIIISADGDLLQCLTDNVMVYSPASKKLTTKTTFIKKWGLVPELWSHVKAIAGCSTDDVVGIRGVGEVTAAKWLTGALNPKSAAYAKVQNGIVDVFDKNLELVSLPLPGLVLPPLVEDAVTPTKMTRVKSSLGIRAKRSEKPSQGPGFDL